MAAVDAGILGIFQSIPLRMPLQSQHKPVLPVLHRFDDAVSRPGRNGQSFTYIFRIDGLVMGRGHHGQGAGAENLKKPLRIRINIIQRMIRVSVVDNIFHLHTQVLFFAGTALRDLFSRSCGAQIAGDILDQPSPQGNVQSLSAPADAEHGDIRFQSAPDQVQIRQIPDVITVGRAVGLGYLAVEGRIPVLTAGDTEAVQPVQHR